MKEIHLSIVVVLALFAGALIGSSSGYRPHIGSSATAGRTSRSMDAPQLTGSQLLFKGKPVDEIVSGNKIKRYSIQLTGTGFVSGSRAIINSRPAFAEDPRSEQEERIATTYESATGLHVQFVKKHAPPPGLLFIKVVNPDGAESNTLAVDVISPSSELSITSISQVSGPTGTILTLRGVGFAPSPTPVFNYIRFTAVGSAPSDSATGFVGRHTDPTSNDNMLTFVIGTSVVDPICPGSKFICDPLRTPSITPQQYRLQVINSNGMSNSVFFQVTP